MWVMENSLSDHPSIEEVLSQPWHALGLGWWSVVQQQLYQLQDSPGLQVKWLEAQGLRRGAERPLRAVVPHLREIHGGTWGRQNRWSQPAQIHQKHFFFTFLVFRLKSCFSGAGGSAGDFGGGDASSVGSASSRLCRTSWNLPSCCRKSYSTLKNKEWEEGK